ncbi:MAG TPA: nitrite/sulfite reductase, partial [Burkholderiales bacterium]|nr:nitrite/sulfite reductase [Burkholderiales bacterium]
VPGFRVAAGGGLGRTPIIGHVIREFLPWQHLLGYLEAILRIYNRHGRRDNIHKARIKILVQERGPEAFAREVEAEWAELKDGPATLTEADVEQIQSRFSKPGTDRDLSPQDQNRGQTTFSEKRGLTPIFDAWERRNVHPHKLPGYSAVTLSLKKTGVPPGDVTAGQMDAIADLAERYSGGELRVTHEQNLVFAHVARRDLPALWQALRAAGLATPNIGLLSNIISCPGGDFCSLANARSIPIAEAIQRRFDDLDYLFDIGELDLNISGCMNACGHHHVGHIGILGVDKRGEEFYQLEIGGSQGAQARLGRVLGPALRAAEVPDAIERLVEVYLERRDSDAERFVDVVHRIGIEPFKENVYAKDHQEARDRRGRLAAA